MLRRSCPTYAAFVLLAASGVEIIRAGPADQPLEENEYISIRICGQYERVEKAGGYTHWIRAKNLPPLEINSKTIIDLVQRSRLEKNELKPGSAITLDGLLGETPGDPREPQSPRHLVCNAKKIDDSAAIAPADNTLAICGHYVAEQESSVIWANSIPIVLIAAKSPEGKPPSGTRVLVNGSLLERRQPDGTTQLSCEVDTFRTLKMPTLDEAASWRAYVEKAKLIDRAGGMTVFFVPQKEPDVKAAPRDQPADRLRKLIDSAGLQIKVLNADSGSLFAVTSRDRKTDPLLIAQLVRDPATRGGKDGVAPTPSASVGLFPGNPRPD